MSDKTPVESIRRLDQQLLVAGERLARYRKTGPSSSVIVQGGVVDRMLDERLVVMAQRDSHPSRRTTP